MATRYKLTYWPVRARAEPIRIILTLAGVDWEDIRDVTDDSFAVQKKGIEGFNYRYHVWCVIEP